jgi:hypothetical protein
MNTDELDCILKRALLRTHLNFRGVFAADRVPKGVGTRVWSCVANTDPHGRPGQHWVAFVFGAESCEYFDPYGMPLEAYPALCEHMRGVACQDVVSASSPVQPPLSSACGHFCIYYLCRRCSLPPERIVRRLLAVSMRARDSFVLQYVRKLTLALGVLRPCRRDLCKGLQCCKPPGLKQ